MAMQKRRAREMWEDLKNRLIAQGDSPELAKDKLQGAGLIYYGADDPRDRRRSLTDSERDEFLRIIELCKTEFLLPRERAVQDSDTAAEVLQPDVEDTFGLSDEEKEAIVAEKMTSTELALCTAPEATEKQKWRAVKSTFFFLKRLLLLPNEGGLPQRVRPGQLDHLRQMTRLDFFNMDMNLLRDWFTMLSEQVAERCPTIPYKEKRRYLHLRYKYREHVHDPKMVPALNQWNQLRALYHVDRREFLPVLRYLEQLDRPGNNRTTPPPSVGPLTTPPPRLRRDRERY